MNLDRELEEDGRRMRESLKQVLWFYDQLSRTNAESTLSKYKKEGMFLLRRSNMCPRDFVLSLHSKNKYDHFLIQDIGGDHCYKMDKGTPVEGLDTLINHYMSAEHGLPTRLQFPCPGGKAPPPHSILKGYTNILHRAVQQGKKEVVQKILHHQYCPDVNWKNSEGIPALHVACMTGQEDITRWLLKAKADVNGLDRHGCTPLHRACQKNQVGIVHILLKEGGANPQKPQRPNMNVPLHDAAKEGHEATVQALLANHIPVWPRNKAGKTPYDFTVKYNKQKCGRLIDNYQPPPAKTKREYWYHDTITREEALELFMSLDMQDGYFLVRRSSKGGYVLSFCCKSQMQNYRIESMHDQACALNEGPYLPSLEHFVEHYAKYMEGFTCKLSHGVATDKTVRLVTTGDIIAPPEAGGDYGTLAGPPPPPRLRPVAGDIYQIPASQLELGAELGQGEYGSVLNGVWHFQGTKTNVAIKTLNEENMGNSKEAFLREAEIMVKFDHWNIVQLLGVCPGPPLMLVQELLTDGSLQDFLLDYPNQINIQDLCRWGAQISCGMNYLEEKKFVHRDLATRNVLLRSKNLAKVGDFGLSRAVGESDYYRATQGGRWPVKWYAPECMYYGTFTHASDVWSFGVTLWEMFSFGDQPYSEKTGAEVVQLIEKGYRLPKPDDCPDNIYNQMRKCWEYEHGKRPTFKNLYKFFNSNKYSNVTLNNSLRRDMAPE